MFLKLLQVCSGVLQLIGILICACAIRYTGKRIMILISGLSSSLICILLAIYLYIEPGIPVIPMVLFAINFLANGLGIMSLPWCLIAEVFPTELVFNLVFFSGLLILTATTFCVIRGYNNVILTAFTSTFRVDISGSTLRRFI